MTLTWAAARMLSSVGDLGACRLDRDWSIAMTHLNYLYDVLPNKN